MHPGARFVVTELFSETGVVKKSVKQQQALRRARDRKPGRHGTSVATAKNAPTHQRHTEAVTDLGMSESVRRRRAATVCGWCGGPIEVKATGRIPKWCSASCRQRAWEQSRAATSGCCAVEVVERRVEIPSPAPPTQATLRPGHRDWAALLFELAGQLDAGRVYDRDIPELSRALNQVLESYTRHPYIRHTRENG